MYIHVYICIYMSVFSFPLLQNGAAKFTNINNLIISSHVQPTGQEMAQSVMEQEYRLERNSATSQQEQQEKARLRYKHALARVRLEREKEEVLGQLKVRLGAIVQDLNR